MEYHLERKLRIQTDVQYKNLYKWAIIETDAHGKTIGQDQIPWVWTLYFLATECIIREGVKGEDNYIGIGDRKPLKINEHQSINIRLRPDWRQTNFSMFGTERSIKDLTLDISSISDPNEKETCYAWGSVSYTSEIDFRTETQNDTLGFTLSVRAENFARYVQIIRDGKIDEIVFSVGGVSGFYSAWSPSISTNRVKILTNYKEQVIDNAADTGIDPPRLGEVGTFGLSLNRQVIFREPERQEGDDDQIVEDQIPPAEREPATIIRFDPEIGRLAQSLKAAAWWMVGLLVVIALGVFFR